MGIFGINKNQLKQKIEFLLEELFPINRSITGEGNRETLRILNEIVPLKIYEIASGEKVFDWTIPKEWKVNEAYIKNSNGEKIVDYSENNLHVVNYSIPIKKELTFQELELHLHTLKNQPTAIPYRTSYYDNNWGFCLEYEKYKNFNKNEKYEVCIDSVLQDGHLTYAECIIEGQSKKEFMFSTYFCHPSMANDNLSGLIIQILLASELIKSKPYYSYRFVFVPETIGAIAYCAKNPDHIKNLEGGFILSNVGGPGEFSYKKSFDENFYLNDVIEQAFKILNINFKIFPFDIHGSDERQYSSIGFRLNMPSVHKDKYYEYDEYHTSLDNLNFVKSDSLLQSFYVYDKIIEIIESNKIYKNNINSGEVRLSKYGLYPKTSGHINQKAFSTQKNNELEQILWLLFLCDGSNDLLQISKQQNFNIIELYKIAEKLKDKGILTLKNE